MHLILLMLSGLPPANSVLLCTPIITDALASRSGTLRATHAETHIVCYLIFYCVYFIRKNIYTNTIAF